MSFARMSLCDLAYLVVGDTEWPNLERETGLEPATPSLEGSRSTN